MKTLNDIFACWGSLDEMAADVGESHWAVKKWRTRRRIPSRAWPKVLRAVERKGKNLSADDLLVMHTRRRSTSPPVVQSNNGSNPA